MKFSFLISSTLLIAVSCQTRNSKNTVLSQDLVNMQSPSRAENIERLARGWYSKIEDLPNMELISGLLHTSFKLNFPSGPVQTTSELNAWIAASKIAVVKSHHQIHQFQVVESSRDKARATASLTWEYTNKAGVASRLFTVAEFEIVSVDGTDKISAYTPHIMPFTSKVTLAVDNLLKSGAGYSKSSLPKVFLNPTDVKSRKTATSKSVPIVDVPLTLESVPALVEGHAYHLTPNFDWKGGVTMLLVATKKAGQSPELFRTELAKHLSIARKILVPQGVRGYIVVAGDDYELAILNFNSAEDKKRIWAAPETTPANQHAGTFLQGISFEVIEL